MLKHIKCHFKHMCSKCYKNQYYRDNISLEHCKNLLPIAEKELQRAIRSMVEEKSIVKVFDMNFNSVKVEQRSKYVDISIKHCSLSPSLCETVIDEQKYELSRHKSKLTMINIRIDKVNSIVEHLKELNKYNKDPKTVEIKFMLDREDNPVCIYFDKAYFEEYSNPNMAYDMRLYLSYGIADRTDRTFIDFTYNHYSGSIKIIEIFSEIRKRGHAKFMLDALESLIPYFNSRLEIFNKNNFDTLKKYEKWDTWDKFKNSSIYNKPITYIHGMICEGKGITREELLEVYDRLGYLKNGRLYKEI